MKGMRYSFVTAQGAAVAVLTGAAACMPGHTCAAASA